MYSLTLLVISLFLASARPSPFPNATPIDENADTSYQPAAIPPKEKDMLLVPDLPAQPINENLAPEKSEIDSQEDSNTIEGSSTTPPEDMMEQETFYPVGIVLLGYRPWWGYRPGWQRWRRPYWGGYGPWRGNWGGRWGGRRWG